MNKILFVIPLALSVLGGSAGSAQSGDTTTTAPSAQTAPDNTGRNARDRDGSTLTPGDQSESKADLDLTQRIRRAVVADKSLSTTGHNIKIITVNGTVTLRGPVKSEKEREKIVAQARKLAGKKQVENELEVVAH